MSRDQARRPTRSRARSRAVRALRRRFRRAHHRRPLASRTAPTGSPCTDRSRSRRDKAGLAQALTLKRDPRGDRQGPGGRRPAGRGGRRAGRGPEIRPEPLRLSGHGLRRAPATLPLPGGPDTRAGSFLYLEGRAYRTGARGPGPDPCRWHAPRSPDTTRRGRSAMAREFIYHMRGLTKAYTGGKKVLDNVNLSFYPDAKIGVLGINGSGKSTLLKIMAGIDKEFTGDGWVAQGARVGYLPQEPQLDPSKSVRENVMEGRGREAGHARPLQRARHELLGGDRRRDDRAPGPDRVARPLGTRLEGRSGHGGARLPERRAAGRDPVGRRAPPHRPLPPAPVGAGAAAARRADQPPRRRDGELARGPPAAVSGRDPDRDPRPLLPRQRHQLDPGTRSRQGHPVRGQLLRLAGAEAEAPGAGGPRGHGPPALHRPRAGVDRRLPEGAAVASRRRASPGTRSWSPSRTTRSTPPRRSSSRSTSGSATTSSSSSTSTRRSATAC